MSRTFRSAAFTPQRQEFSWGRLEPLATYGRVEHSYGSLFVELIETPFRHADLIWGIVPLYFGWLFNELTSAKRSFRTAIQTGFSFLWAGAHWTYQSLQTHPRDPHTVSLGDLMVVHVVVTILVLVTGLLALVSGLRRKYPPY